MNSSKIFSLFIIVCVTLGLVWGGFYVFKNQNEIRNQIKKSIPDPLDLNQVNMPGKIFGPDKNSAAQNLDAEKIIYWTNQHRAENSIPPLKKNANLTLAAKTKVDDMFTKQYFEHISPSGQKPGDLVLQSGYNFQITGENLAMGNFSNEEDLVKAWMASPGHRANILNKEYTEIGVASKLSTFKDKNFTWMSVQEFGRPSPQCEAPNKDLLNNVNVKKTEYDQINKNIDAMISQYKDLENQANSKTEQGNKIYEQTKDETKAKPFWDDGERIGNLAAELLIKINELEIQSKTLFENLQLATKKYNDQVNSYNSCIKK